ncbi:MAG: hypothetical protein Q7K43_04450 [Candidatus Woesearchaeota archaeon]|nr:hypothetical protein [Candidatus Woesearchaeota archaeon]
MADEQKAEGGVITYETLYDLFRREKNKEEIQELSAVLYQDILRYLREKQAYYDSCMSKSDIFSLSEREKTLQQLQNAKRIIKDLYERREKKIIELAINKSRTNSDLINTQYLLPEEKTFYEMFLHALNTSREGILIKLLALQQPSIRGILPLNVIANSSTVTQQGTLLSESSNHSSESHSLQDTPTNAHATTESSAINSSQVSSTKTKLLQFISPIDQFLGEELEPYGPYNPEDKAYIPSILAEILITTGKAREISEE